MLIFLKQNQIMLHLINKPFQSVSMKAFKLIFFAILFISVNTFSQTPTDYLSKEFHKERREVLRAKMPKNSVTVVFANSIRNRANDVDYVFHQDPNFYYLTGYREPNAVLVIYADDQTNEAGETFNEVLYVQERNPQAEQWNGKRLGTEGAKNELGFAQAFNGMDFINSKIDFKQFDKVFIEKFNDDHRNSTRDKAEVFDLVKSFKLASGYNPSSFLSPTKKYIYNLIKKTPIENRAELSERIKASMQYYPELQEDDFIKNYINAEVALTTKDIEQKVTLGLKSTTNLDVDFLSSNLATMRETKSPEEMKLLTKAVRISAIGQIEMMKAMKPHMSETEVQGIHEFVYKKYGAEYEGYPSIVGAGNNGCILHYIENNKTKVGHELVLMDLGAEYRGYTADVTRTIPANGKFTKEQKEIYDLVYKAQEAGIAEYVIGGSMRKPNQTAIKIVNEGLFALGIIKSADERHNYFPHGTSHHIGLDVHDPGNYGNFEENMVVTMEPGIYIPEGSNCDKKWWGIAVRIEDDILVTKNGPVNLSGEAPRKSDEIEKMMAKKSVLDDFILPNLDK